MEQFFLTETVSYFRERLLQRLHSGFRSTNQLLLFGWEGVRAQWRHGQRACLQIERTGFEPGLGTRHFASLYPGRNGYRRTFSLMLGVTLRWTGIPSTGNWSPPGPSRFMLRQKPGQAPAWCATSTRVVWKGSKPIELYFLALFASWAQNVQAYPL